MPLAVLQQKLETFPEEYFEEIETFFDFLSYKVSVLSVNPQASGQKVIPGLAEGKWKYPKDINAFDDEIEKEFEGYL